jgi:hypothetical protein
MSTGSLMPGSLALHPFPPVAWRAAGSIPSILQRIPAPESDFQIHINPLHLNYMLKKSILFAAALLPVPVVQGAITTNLVAYWNFEGNSDNHPVASGGAAFNGTLSGGATTTGTAKAGTGALGLDGIDDYMDVTSNVTANSAWTVSAWFRSDIAPVSPTRAAVYESTDNTSGGGNAFSMYFGLRDGTTVSPAGTAAQTGFEVFTRFNGTNASASTLVDDAAVANTWYHTLTVFTPATPSATGSMVTYRDGIQLSTITLPAGAVLEPFAGFHLGTFRAANGRWFDGSIDEVAIWNRSLTAGEVTEVYTLGNSAQAVPEPSVFLLAGLGLFGLLGRRR